MTTSRSLQPTFRLRPRSSRIARRLRSLNPRLSRFCPWQNPQRLNRARERRAVVAAAEAVAGDGGKPLRRLLHRVLCREPRLSR
jgi:hypothetical protein